MFKKIINYFRSFRQSRSSNYDHILRSIDEFKNRPIYKELTTEIIDGTDDDKLLQTIFDNLLEKVNWDDGSLLYQDVMALSEHRRAIFVIWCLDGEVNNGGFNQFYFNSTGALAEFAPPAFELVGATGCAQVVAKANNTYKAEFDKITKHQDGTLEGFSRSYEENPLSELDLAYYDLSEKENLWQLQINFIRENKNYFIDK